MTPKTVEVHLSNAYRKLGIRSRRELAGALDGGLKDWGRRLGVSPMARGPVAAMLCP